MDRIVVLDFGSQYAHLIAKRLRSLGYFAEIEQPTAEVASLTDARGIILSGGPATLDDPKAPDFNREILRAPELGTVPILGLCYGHYLIAKEFGGEIGHTETGEYGLAEFEIKQHVGCPLFKGIAEVNTQVWMSHMDQVTKMPDGFVILGKTKNCQYAGFYEPSMQLYALQFHPEVTDTLRGAEILENFAKEICKMEKNWDTSKVLTQILEDIKKEAEGKNVMLFLSGGVDSTVTYALLNKALGKNRVKGLHIDNGFMRMHESDIVAKSYRNIGFDNLIVEDFSDGFLEAVAGLTDPQEKRKAIGDYFVKAKDIVAKKYQLDDWMLAQGTLYPDIIESGGTKNSNVIKTHHNRSPKIMEMLEKGLLLEPLKDLYKNEVRQIGEELGLPHEMIYRHPFPGPGLAINVLCTDGSIPDDYWKAQDSFCEALFSSAEILDEMNYSDVAVDLLEVKSTGVQGDQRTYAYPLALTYWPKPPLRKKFWRIPDDWDEVDHLSRAFTNNFREINRVVMSLYSRHVNRFRCHRPATYCTKENLDQVRQVDEIVLNHLRAAGWYDQVFQHLTIRLPREYYAGSGHCAVVLRTVCSEDVMTARFARLPQELLAKIVKDIANECAFVDEIFYDVTNKPPATFGWE